MKTLSENRRARFDYEILETFEAGVELTGQEVKSAKGGQFNLNSSYAVLKNNEAWLLNSQIPAYQPKNAPADYNPERTRRLLLHSSEIKSLTGRLHEKGLSLIPLNAHIKKNLVKLELGLSRS
ncbi:MAG: SsrA-binding protein SmpB, partial [Candidatus Liptonbacteria bacterium]|nr:SsrA-binding protein SmpB [Candidatus Liptonbacteria bacterium]